MCTINLEVVDQLLVLSEEDLKVVLSVAGSGKCKLLLRGLTGRFLARKILD